MSSASWVASRRAAGAILGLAACVALGGAVPFAAPPRGDSPQSVSFDAPICPSTTIAVAGAATGSANITSVGITYFAGRSRTGDDAHLAQALTNELARQLLSARVSSATPRRRSSNPGLLTVKLSNGGTLPDVDLSMTGSVFRDDTLLRTSVKVTRTSDGSLVYAGSKSRPILELPILARIIAQEVVTRVGAQLTTPAPHGVAEKSTDIYELILLGMYPRSRYAPDDLTGAIDYLEQALKLDPTSTRARDLRETAQLRLLTWGGKGGDVEMRLIGKGMLRRVMERDRDESERLVDEADAEMRDGQYAHACKLLNAAIDNDARSAPAYALRSLIRARAGQVREAFADAETVTQLGRPLWGNSLRAVTLRRTGDTNGARQEARRLAASVRPRTGFLAFWDARMLATALAQAGDAAAAQAIVARIDPQDPRLSWLKSDPVLKAPIPDVRTPRRLR